MINLLTRKLSQLQRERETDRKLSQLQLPDSQSQAAGSRSRKTETLDVDAAAAAQHRRGSMNESSMADNVCVDANSTRNVWVTDSKDAISASLTKALAGDGSLEFNSHDVSLFVQRLRAADAANRRTDSNSNNNIVRRELHTVSRGDFSDTNSDYCVGFDNDLNSQFTKTINKAKISNINHNTSIELDSSISNISINQLNDSDIDEALRNKDRLEQRFNDLTNEKIIDFIRQAEIQEFLDTLDFEMQ